MGGSIFAIVDSNGKVTNISLWDGGSDWIPPEGCTAILVPDGSVAEIGGSYIDGEFKRNPENESALDTSG